MGLDKLIRETVSRKEMPPRRFDSKKLFMAILEKKSLKLLVLIGAVLSLWALFGIAQPAPSDTDRSMLVLRMGALLFGALLIWTPFSIFRRLRHALETCPLGYAEVITVDKSGPGARDTLDSIKHGIARGLWRVVSQGSSFEAKFEIDEDWAMEIIKGSKVCVLFDPRKKKVFYSFGLEHAV